MITKNWLYFKYVCRHRWFVFLECCALGVPWRGIVHDLSKFRPCEWVAYTDYFYGEKPLSLAELQAKYPGDTRNYNWHEFSRTKESVKGNFDRAWLYHQRINKHHPQWWILKYDDGQLICIEMPIAYVKEMVADWRGASRAIKGFDDTINWYEQNKDKMQLHVNTRQYVEKLIYGAKDT